jgi:hypothetical protein
MGSSQFQTDSPIENCYIPKCVARDLPYAKRKESLIRSHNPLFSSVKKMPLSRRLLYSSLLGIALVILLVGSSVSAMTAYGYSLNQATNAQTGWEVSWTMLTGPATVSLPNGQTLQLQSMLSTGSCDLTGAISGMNAMAGNSGECKILAIVNAVGASPSICEASFTLDESSPNPSLPDHGDPLPFAWAAVPMSGLPYPSELNMFYGIPVNDFRVSSHNLVTPRGFNTGLCSAFLFEGYSADLFVPAQAGHFDYTGTPGAFGTLMFYGAQVHATHSHGHHGD